MLNLMALVKRSGSKTDFKQPMLNNNETIEILKGRFPRDGEVAWLSVRPQRRQPVRVVDAVQAVAGKGLTGDRYHSSNAGKRQLTLIQMEHLPVIASLAGWKDPDPALLRRNIGVRGINLLALRGKRLRLGPVLVELTVPCNPCSHMEEALGEGGYNAMRGHGGMCARILESGVIRLGDAIKVAA